jgi:excinuclease ABC subunit A
LLAWGANRRLSGQAGIHPYPSAPARATLNLLNEPTTSLLYMVDTARLLVVLGPLVDSGITVGIVEHNLELIKTANWVIDLEPDGGVAGGRVIAEGNPD